MSILLIPNESDDDRLAALERTTIELPRIDNGHRSPVSARRAEAGSLGRD
jgi:hypothetical protein